MELNTFCVQRWDVSHLVRSDPLDPSFRAYIADFSGIGPAGIKHIAAAGLWEWLAKRYSHSLESARYLVMESSGNAGVAFTMAAAKHGKEVKVVVSRALERGKLAMLEQAGAHIVFPSEGETPVSCAQRLGLERGHLEVNQYTCPGNPEMHAKITGQAICRAFGVSELKTIVCATGSCGTIVGLDIWRNSILAPVTLVATRPQEGDRVPGARDNAALQNVAFAWHKAADYECELPARAAYEASARLVENGVPLGPSTGLGMCALELLRENGAAASLGGTVVIVGADSFEPYLEEYREYGFLG